MFGGNFSTFCPKPKVRILILCFTFFAFAVEVLFGISCHGDSPSKSPSNGAKKTVDAQLEELPAPSLGRAAELNRVFQQRRSVRGFLRKRLSKEDISLILWAGFGFKRGEDSSIQISEATRPAPSAGRIYGLKIYVLSEGKLHLYLPEQHSLSLFNENVDADELASACLNQGFIAQAPCILIITAVMDEYRASYGERGMRYVYIDTGHASQNVLLEAEALGLGTVPVGAFDDEEVARILGITKNEQPIYIIPVGYYQ